MKIPIITARIAGFQSRKKFAQAESVKIFFAATMLLLATVGVRGQSAYSNAVMSLNPAGYWPMHETTAPAPGDIETNYGTLGLLGTGYYPDWAANYGGIVRNAPGALAGDPDTAAHFTRGTGNTGTVVFYTNGLYVPQTSPLTTLNPPFTVECWYYPTNGPTGEDIWAQMGFVGLNAGSEGSDVGNVCGIRLAWANSTFVVYYLNNQGGVGVLNAQKEASGAEALNNWYHVVVTCSATTNIALFVNGNPVTSGNRVGQYSPDSWTPINIGCGQGNTRSSAGLVDEFAVYTNNLALADIAQHYSDGINAAPATSYYYDVTNDNPVIYLRMDAPAYSPPAVASWPVMSNLGSAGANGVYTPGTMPGILTGPLFNGSPAAGVINNSALLSGISSFGSAGYAAAYDPTGSNANFTVTALFRGNPCDGRIQSIVGHGTNSWQLGMITNGCIVFNAGNGNKAAGATGAAAGDFRTAGVYNDGNWHQVVAVNSTNVMSIYVDGVLDTNGTPAGIATTNIIPGNAGGGVMIGSEPVYTNNPAGKGRSFAGQICEVAFYSSALTAGQVQTLYNASGVVPNITQQPATGRFATGGLGTFINFGVKATGSFLAYQWYFNTSASYSGATPLVNNVVHYTNSTTSQATVTNLSNADTGYYFVVVTNNFGSVTSTLASLTIANLGVWKGNLNSNWDIATTANWTFNGSASDYFDGNIVQFDDTASRFNVNVAADVSPTGIIVTNNHNAYTFSGSDGILAGQIVKSGTNTLTLAVVDSSSAGITVNGGTLVIGDGTSNGGVTTGSIIDNGTVVFDRSDTNGSFSTGISGSGAVIVNANTSGQFQLGGADTYLGNTILQSGMLTVLGSASIPAVAGGGNLTINASGVLDMGGNSVTVNGLFGSGSVTNQTASPVVLAVGANNTNSTFAGSIADLAPGLVSLSKTNNGTLFLTGTNYFTGVFTFYGGTVNVASFSDYSDAPSSNAGPSALGQRASNQETASANGVGLEFSSGTLQYTGSTPQETDRTIRLLFGVTNTIDASGSNPNATLYWSYGDVQGPNVNLFNGVGVHTVQLTGSNTGTNTFDILVTDQGVNGTVINKTGAGTWCMFGGAAIGPNNYSGVTTVSQGTLVISTTHNDLNGSVLCPNGLGAFTVSDGAILDVTDGGNANPALMKTLTVGSSSGGTLGFLNIPSTNVAMVSATSTVLHGTCTFVCATNNLAAADPYATYPLLTYGTLSGNYTLTPMPGPLYYKLTNDTVNIDLLVASTPFVNITPVPLTFSVSDGTNLVLSWPLDHTGWRLQSQTNSLNAGLGTNWVAIPGTDLNNSYTNTIKATNKTVFYRMIYP